MTVPISSEPRPQRVKLPSHGRFGRASQIAKSWFGVLSPELPIVKCVGLTPLPDAFDQKGFSSS
jgi:hypothetical protein